LVVNAPTSHTFMVPMIHTLVPKDKNEIIMSEWGVMVTVKRLPYMIDITDIKTRAATH